jgi:hypothetical protein
MNTEPLKEQVSGYMTSCLKAKSHSVSNTKRTVQQIIDTAISTRSTEKEKDVLRWVQFCVETCLSQQEQADASPPSTKKSSTSDENISNADTPRPKKKVPAKKEAVVKEESDSECQDEDEDDVESVGYDKIGASDDDYVPSYDDGDQQVPSTPSPRRKTKPKKEKEDGPDDDDDNETKKKPVARRKKEEEQPAFILPNAGSKAVVSYFTSAHPLAASEKSGLTSNHFAKSFFFPSKESFNVSQSVDGIFVVTLFHVGLHVCFKLRPENHRCLHLFIDRR